MHISNTARKFIPDIMANLSILFNVNLKEMQISVNFNIIEELEIRR